MALHGFRRTHITLNKANQRMLETQIAKVGDDNGRELVVQITNGGKIEDQTGTTLKLNWQHENGNQGSTDFVTLDIKTGKFFVYYPKAMLYKGEVNASIEVTLNGQITNSLNFKIIVQADVFNGEAGTVNGVFISLADVNKKLDDREKEYVDLKNRQTTVENQFNSIQQDLTNKDIVSAPEIIAARNGEANLKSRLDKEQQEVTTQLAQNERVLKNNIIKRLSNVKVDPFGFKSINIIGDSISHGANAPYIYHDAWTAIFRNAIQLSFETDNYGFVNIMPPLSNAQGTYVDQIYTSTNWTRENTTDTPGFFQLKSSIPDQYIRLSVQDKKYQVNKVGVAVKKTTQGGEVNIKVLSSTFSVVNEKTISLQSSTNQQDIIWLDTDNSSDVHRVDITNLSGTNILTGVYLMEYMDNIVVNNYSRSGARIEDLSDSLIDKLFNTNVVIFALGHNSNPANIDSYLEKCRVAYETYKPYVYIVDLTWTNARSMTGKKLEKFASDVNGEYIEIIDRVENANELIESGFLTDVSHPSVEGHRVIGESVLVAVKSPVTSKALINNFYNAQSTIPIEKTIVPASQYTLNPSSWVKTNRLNVVTLDISGEIKSGNVITTIEPSLQSLNLIGYAWGTDEGLISCPFTINGSTGALTVYPPRALIGNRFTASFSYISKT